MKTKFTKRELVKAKLSLKQQAVYLFREQGQSFSEIAKRIKLSESQCRNIYRSVIFSICRSLKWDGALSTRNQVALAAMGIKTKSQAWKAFRDGVLHPQNPIPALRCYGIKSHMEMAEWLNFIPCYRK